MTEEHIKKLALKYKFKTEDGKTYQCTKSQLQRYSREVEDRYFNALWDYMEHLIKYEGTDFTESLVYMKNRKSKQFINYVADQIWM